MVNSYKNKFNKKYGFEPDKSHSLAEISKLTGYKKSGLETILDKGRGAFFSARKSVRPNIKDPTAWGMARIYSAVNPLSKAHQIDKSHLIKK